MTFTQKLSFLDHLKVYLSIQLRPPWLWAYLFFPIASVVSRLLRIQSPSELLTHLLSGILVSVTLLTILSLSGTLIARRSSPYTDPMTFTFNENGIGIQTFTMKVEYKWLQIYQLLESKDFFIFYFSFLGGIGLLKSVIPSEQLEPLRQLLRTHTGDKIKF